MPNNKVDVYVNEDSSVTWVPMNALRTTRSSKTAVASSAWYLNNPAPECGRRDSVSNHEKSERRHYPFQFEISRLVAWRHE